MKQTKKPTRANKELMVKHKLVPDNWRVIEETKEQLILINTRGRRRTLNKEG